jgi:hypothetical protein
VSFFCCCYASLSLIYIILSTITIGNENYHLPLESVFWQLRSLRYIQVSFHSHYYYY